MQSRSLERKQKGRITCGRTGKLRLFNMQVHCVLNLSKGVPSRLLSYDLDLHPLDGVLEWS